MITKVELPQKSFYNLREAASALEMNVATLRKFVKAGRVPCVLNDGRFYRVPRVVVERIKNGEIAIDAAQD